MTRSFSLGLVVTALALSSCASRQRVAAGVHIDLGVREYGDEIRIQWTIRNLEPETIRVLMPDTDQYGRGPLPFVVPTGDLVFVFGYFQLGDHRPVPEWEGWEPRYSWGLIRPGRAARGTICLALPYEITHCIPNTYERSPRIEGIAGKPATIVRAEGLYVVAQYSKLGSGAAARAARGFEPWEDRMRRATLGRSMVFGDMDGGLAYQVTDGIAVSRRVAVDIQLKDAAFLWLPDRPRMFDTTQDDYYADE